MKKIVSRYCLSWGLLIALLLSCRPALGQEAGWRMIGQTGTVQSHPLLDGSGMEVALDTGAKAWVWREGAGSVEIAGPARLRLAERITLVNGRILVANTESETNPIVLSFAENIAVEVRGEVWVSVEANEDQTATVYFPQETRIQFIPEAPPASDSDSTANQAFMGWKLKNGSWSQITIDGDSWKQRVAEVTFTAEHEWNPLFVDILPEKQEEQSGRTDGEDSQNNDTEAGGGGDAALCMDPSGEGGSAGDINQDPEGVVIEPGMSRVRLEIRWEE